MCSKPPRTSLSLTSGLTITPWYVCLSINLRNISLAPLESQGLEGSHPSSACKDSGTPSWTTCDDGSLEYTGAMDLPEPG